MILLCYLASALWQQLELAYELESHLQDTGDWGRKWLVDFNTGKPQLVSFDRSNNSGAIDVKINGWKLRCQGWLFLPNWIGALTLSLLLKLPPIKWEPWFVLWSFFSWGCSTLYKSTIQPCMEYCSDVWAGAPSCYLELLHKLQKQIYRIIGHSVATSIETLAHCQNVASWSLFYWYYICR